ncbi:MAG: electron transfer flavoprotein subunit alpha/FixB family protein [Acidimicrobiia bacterium]|nr:electron transfer flavoprotein subunit alpha/FixB family protein [Acidimicrobiia bacterium]MDX2466367.1 electron transfer flavoprotein subunit alpha/FixB family protein [Acidimicrobiia bacterium]
MTTWVFCEELEGTPSASSLELLTKARSWGDTEVFYVGAGSDTAFAALGAHGASKVHHLDTGDALPAPLAAAALATLVDESDVLLFGTGNTERDVAGRLSARVGCPVLSNATDVDPAGDQVMVTNEILGGTTKVITAATAGPVIVVTRPKAFPAEPGDGATPDVVAVAVPDAGHAGSAVVLERHVEESEGPDLEAAAIVVGGGRGMGGADDKWEPVAKLAGLLGGAVAATRAVVDAGWVPYSLQVGQTGKTVKPDVYIACGISGAMQHLVGMKDSSTIIAINKDPEAPIFSVADLGIIGDVHNVMPALIAALEAR